MECPFAEQISRYVDGELDAAASERLEAHLESCDACRRARDEFLAIRQRVAGLDSGVDRVAQQRALRDVLARPALPAWRRRVAVPTRADLAVAASLLVAIVAIAVLGLTRTSPVAPPAAPVAIGSPAGIDLSRFDRGGRAAVVVRRVEERR